MHFEYITIVSCTHFTGWGRILYNQIMGQLYIIIFVKCLCPFKCVYSLKVGHNKSWPHGSFWLLNAISFSLEVSSFIALRPWPSALPQDITCERQSRCLPGLTLHQGFIKLKGLKMVYASYLWGICGKTAVSVFAFLRLFLILKHSSSKEQRDGVIWPTVGNCKYRDVS